MISHYSLNNYFLKLSRVIIFQNYHEGKKKIKETKRNYFKKLQKCKYEDKYDENFISPYSPNNYFLKLSRVIIF